jgi:hypothetical protein
MNSGALVIVVLLAGAGVMWAFSSGAKAGRKIERRAREVSRGGHVAMISVLIGLVVALVQWAVLTHVTNPTFTTLALVLGVPGWLAGITVGRLFAVTTTINAAAGGTSRKGARR